MSVVLIQKMINLNSQTNFFLRYSRQSYKNCKYLKSTFSWDKLHTSLLTNSGVWQERLNPIKVNATYVDTGHQLPQRVSSKFPNVLLLQNIPNEESDIIDLAEKFYEKNCRVIIPDWPFFGGSSIDDKMDKTFFNFQTEELGLFVLNFLNSISIDRVDSIVCHGNSIAAGLTFATQIQNSMRLRQFTSILPSNIFSLDSRINVSNTYLNWKYNGSLIQKLLSILFLEPSARYSFGQGLSKEQSLAVAQFVSGIDMNNSAGSFFQLRHNRLPFLFVFSGDIESKNTLEKLGKYLDLPVTIDMEDNKAIDLAMRQSYSLIFSKKSDSLLKDDFCLDKIVNICLKEIKKLESLE